MYSIRPWVKHNVSLILLPTHPMFSSSFCWRYNWNHNQPMKLRPWPVQIYRHYPHRLYNKHYHNFYPYHHHRHQHCNLYHHFRRGHYRNNSTKYPHAYSFNHIITARLHRNPKAYWNVIKSVFLVELLLGVFCGDHFFIILFTDLRNEPETSRSFGEHHIHYPTATYTLIRTTVGRMRAPRKVCLRSAIKSSSSCRLHYRRPDGQVWEPSPTTIRCLRLMLFVLWMKKDVINALCLNAFKNIHYFTSIY